jgi:hypothetical protein
MRTQARDCICLATFFAALLSGSVISFAQSRVASGNVIASFDHTRTEINSSRQGGLSTEASGNDATWSIQPYGLALAGLDDSPAVDLYGGGIGINRSVSDTLALRGELYGIGAEHTGTDTVGGGFNLIGRWHFYRKDNWSVFAEGGAGMLQTADSLPDGVPGQQNDGTHFNFTTHLGVGGAYQLRDSIDFVGALRFTHISNAGLSGSDENPGINAIGGYVGLSIAF